MSLVSTPQLRALYNDAVVKPEHATKRFWGYVLKEKFKGSEWNVSSEQPPTQEPGDLRRMDQFVERFGHGKWTGIVLVEVKRQSALVRDLQEVESQAFTACCAHLHWHNLQEVFVITAFGPNARIWSYTATHDYLTPYVPNTSGLSAKDEYINADTAKAASLTAGFEFIYKNLKPSKIRNSPPSSPRPAKLTLPSNWHFDEVELIAGTPKFPLKGLKATKGVYQGDDDDGEFDDEGDYDDDIQVAAPSGHMITSSVAAAGTLTRDEARNRPSEAGDDEMDVDDSEPAAGISADTPYVEVTRKVITHTFRDDEVLYCFGSRETTKDSWKSSTISYGGKVMPCIVYTSSKGLKYWTWALPKSKGKGKS